MPNRFASRPYAFDHGVLFSFHFDLEVRQVFVGPSLFQKYDLASAKDRERVAYVTDHAPILIEIAKAKALAGHRDGMILIDHEDL